MENQEQKSQSENTSKISISPLATPYRALIPIDAQEFKLMLDQHWNLRGELIVKKYNIKARNPNKARKIAESQLGVLKVYEDILVNKALKVFKEEDIHILSIEDMDLHGYKDCDPVDISLVVIYYSFPELDFNSDLNHEIEDPIDTDFDKAWEHKKKTLEATVTEDLPLEKLVRQEGFESLEKLKESFLNEYIAYVKTSRVSSALENLIGQIIENSVLPSIPQKFVDTKATELLENHKSAFKGNKKLAYEAIGAVNENSARAKFVSQVMLELMNAMALAELSKIYEVDLSDEESLRDAVLNHVTWITKKEENDESD